MRGQLHGDAGILLLQPLNYLAFGLRPNSQLHRFLPLRDKGAECKHSKHLRAIAAKRGNSSPDGFLNPHNNHNSDDCNSLLIRQLDRYPQDTGNLFIEYRGVDSVGQYIF